MERSLSMTRSPVARAAALGLLLAFAGGARADLIPWTFNWEPSTGKITADSPGTGYITLTDEKPNQAVGETDVVATNLRTFSTATRDKPDHFTAKNYTLSLTLVDVLSGKGGTVAFTGNLDGTLTAQSANIKNTFTGQLTRQLVLGQHVYTITIDKYTPPGPPGSSNAGSINAHVKVTNFLPEPGA